MANCKEKSFEYGIQRAITSREYKLLLYPMVFRNGEKDACKLWDHLVALVQNERGEILKTQLEEKQRKTRYIDTADFGFRNRGVVLRHRKTIDDPEKEKKHKITLKYRGTDRYLASSFDISEVDEEVETKFEEDILAGGSKYSLSGSYRKKKTPKSLTIGKLQGKFPVLDTLHLSNDTPLVTVNGFEAFENTFWLGQAQFEDGHVVKFCLTFWYRDKGFNGIPIVTEVSFDYDLIEKDKAWPEGQVESYHLPTVRGANAVFNALRKRDRWVNPHATTKTAYAYEGR